MNEIVVYIQTEVSSEVNNDDVCIGDVASVYCKDRKLKKEIENLVFLHIASGDQKKYVVSFMALVSCIDQSISENVVIQNIGENEFIVSHSLRRDSRWIVKSKVLLVTMITFFGSIFAMMTYNEDVNLQGVFEKVYIIITGKLPAGPGILEASYAVGVAMGIILFFNHFGKAKLSKEPTPMEIEMEQYEENITKTVIKESARKHETLNGQEE